MTTLTTSSSNLIQVDPGTGELSEFSGATLISDVNSITNAFTNTVTANITSFTNTVNSNISAFTNNVTVQINNFMNGPTFTNATFNNATGTINNSTLTNTTLTNTTFQNTTSFTGPVNMTGLLTLTCPNNFYEDANSALNINIPVNAPSGTCFANINGYEWLYVTGNTNTVVYLGSVTFPSDYRLKQDVIPIKNPLERCLKLKPKNYRMISDVERGYNNEYEGFIAHEAQDIIPSAVLEEKDSKKECKV